MIFNGRVFDKTNTAKRFREFRTWIQLHVGSGRKTYGDVDKGRGILRKEKIQLLNLAMISPAARESSGIC
jgi:hypothetical protein